MCLMIYLGSAGDRPTSVWIEAAPQFFVEKEKAAIEQLGSTISKPFIYYVGSHEGCGCGFRRDGYWFEDDVENLQKTAENHQKLFDYVDDCLKDEESVEIVACWAGDEAAPVESKREIVAEEILRENFFFKDSELITVKKSFKA